MKRIHYLLLGLGLSVCIAAVAPSISGDGSRLTNVTAVQVVMTNGASIVPGGGGRLSVKDTNGNAMINIAPYSYTELKYTDATSGDNLGVRINTNGFNITGTVGSTTYAGGISNNQWYGNGAGLTNITGWRSLTNCSAGMPMVFTNIISQLVSWTNSYTNVCQTNINLPALPSPWAILSFHYNAYRTANINTTVLAAYIGQNSSSATNLFYNPNFINGTATRSATVPAVSMVTLIGNYTNAPLSTSVFGNDGINHYLTAVDFSQPFTVRLVFTDNTLGGGTNSVVFENLVFDVYIP